MKTILITGGASGIGKALAMHYLNKGERVIALGSSSRNGELFYSEAKQLGAEERATYIQADLSLVKENHRIIQEVKSHVLAIDSLVFCAAKHSKTYTETAEGLEFTFALDYLSRFILSYGLKELLEQADNPLILNICGSGMKGNVNWSDLQHKKNFSPQKVMMHGSRLNDLSGVAFAQSNADSKTKYILYNPMAVQTPGMAEFSGPLMKLIYKFIGKPVEKAIIPITDYLDNPPVHSLSAFRERKKLDLSLQTYNKEDAKRLYEISAEIVKNTMDR